MQTFLSFQLAVQLLDLLFVDTRLPPFLSVPETTTSVKLPPRASFTGTASFFLSLHPAQARAQPTSSTSPARAREDW